MTTATLEAKTTDFDVERHRISPSRQQAAPGARVQAARGGPVSGSGRVPWRRLVHERPPDRTASPRIHGLARHRVDCARFPLRQRRPLSGLGAGHQLCGALGQAARPRAENAARNSIGISGQSSGGHLAMLVAMRPHDPRYAAIALPAGSPAHDASVRCVVMSWPVINPLSRYRHAKRAHGNAAANGQSHHCQSRFLLAQRGQHGRGQSDAGARARRESRAAAGGLVPGPRRSTCTITSDAEFDFPGNEPQRFCANYKKAGGEIDA